MSGYTEAEGKAIMASLERENAYFMAHMNDVDIPDDHEHEWETDYPVQTCLVCGREEDAPEPDYGDPRGET